jgi:hypothetical protein
VNGLFGFIHQPYQVRPAVVSQIKLQHRLIAEFKKFDAEMVFPGLGVLFDELIIFQRHQDAVRRALVQPGPSADLADAQLFVIESEAVHDLRCAIENLNAIAIRRGSGLARAREFQYPVRHNSLVSYHKTSFRSNHLTEKPQTIYVGGTLFQDMRRLEASQARE